MLWLDSGCERILADLATANCLNSRDDPHSTADLRRPGDPDESAAVRLSRSSPAAANTPTDETLL